jgi:hypothetical protein
MTSVSSPQHAAASHPQKSNQTEPLSLRAYSLITGLTPAVLRKYCNQGRVLGARQHHLSKQWWIYPPAVIMPNQKRW